MKETTEVLVNVLGEDLVEQILRNYFQSQLSPLPKKTKVAKVVNGEKVPYQRNAKAWTKEERLAVAKRATELYQVTPNWASISVTIAKETGRTVSSIYNAVYKYIRTHKSEIQELERMSNEIK